MTTPAQRGRDPQPMNRGGQVALVALAGVALLLVLAALVGLGVAAALFGGGWVWPAGNDTVGAVAGGLLSGHPGAGLPSPAAARVPASSVVYGVVAVVEVLTVALAALVGVLFWRYHRPGDARRGMATRDEAIRVLGTGRLQAAKAVLRPDLRGVTGGAGPAGAGR